MGQISIGKPIDTSFIRCCSCGKGYEIKGNLYEGNILICPYCGLKHKLDFTLLGNKIKKIKKVERLNLATYDIGNAAIDRNNSSGAGTHVDKNNPADGTGRITSIEIWANTDLTNCEVATFFVVSGDNLSTRDSETIGTVTAGSKQTFVVNLDVVVGDYIGIKTASGGIEVSTDASGYWWYFSGDAIPCTDETFTLEANRVISLYGKGPNQPTVTAQAVTDIEETTATGNGNITDLGGENCTKRGICWNITGSPTIADSKSEETGSFGTGAFTRPMTGLIRGDRYYVKAYAYNSAGYAYSGEVNFYTYPAAPTNVAATDGVHTDKVVITWTKSNGATGYKIYEGVNLLDTLGDVAIYDDTAASAPTITPGTAAASDATSAAHVSLSLSGQSANNGASRTYKVKALNATGESSDSSTNVGYRGVGSLTYQWQRSSGDFDFSYSNIDGATTASYNDTGAPENGDGRYYKCVEDATGATQQTSSVDRGYRTTGPTVTTQAVSAILEITATGNGNITDTGDDNATKRGVCWNTTGSPTVADNKSEETGSFGTGAFTRAMTGLARGDRYYVRAYAYNSAGYSYGSEVEFYTNPAVTTYTPTDIIRADPTEVTVNGKIDLDVAEDITTRGFKYGLTEVDTWNESETGTYSEGTFSLMLAGLDANTTYYIRVYATGAWGTKFGSYLEFKTAFPYGSFKSRITAEATASDTDIAKVGGERSLAIDNHLIQTQTIADLVAAAYLADYKDQKTKLVITRPTPPPFVIGDTIKVQI